MASAEFDRVREAGTEFTRSMERLDPAEAAAQIRARRWTIAGLLAVTALCVAGTAAAISHSRTLARANKERQDAAQEYIDAMGGEGTVLPTLPTHLRHRELQGTELVQLPAGSIVVVGSSSDLEPGAVVPVEACSHDGYYVPATAP